MTSVYLYAVSYDLGFAPNPYGGLCSLACCKPRIRNSAKHGDWVIGLTGTKLKPALRCVFAMIVTADVTFDDYWKLPEFGSRKPRRNGTRKKLVGDNIYHRDAAGAPWVQEDSVHSLEEGEQCPLNTAHDTQVNRVLLSDQFIYFGASAPPVPRNVLNRFGYERNYRDFRRFDAVTARPILDWLKPQMAQHPNAVMDDPINFQDGFRRFSATRKKLV